MKKYLKKINLEITPLVAYGLVALMAIIFWLGLVTMKDSVQGVKARAQDSRQRLADLTQIKATNVWEERLAVAQKLNAQTQSSIWSGATYGVIAARAEQGLATIAQQLNIEKPLISVTPDADSIDGVDFLGYNFRGMVEDGEGFVKTLQAFTDSPQRLIIHELAIPFHDNRPSLLIVSGRFPIKITQPSSPDGGEQ
ncbi:MAG TPA: hypothetical protein ENJ46_05190 [Hellea balneolensis]|uniref:Uncharacterized protein n=1 Tax=Hellea balneolensis TaxID=287478 RepID=A0A7C3C245_9PROT|nr:hypothetical protein [Hellea balneolensis]